MTPTYFTNHTTCNIHNLQPINFIVTAHFDDACWNQKATVALKINSLPYGMDIDELLRDSNLEQDIKTSLSEKGVILDRVWAMSIRLSRNGERRYFDWHQNTLYV